MESRSDQGRAFTCGAWPPNPGRPTLVMVHGAGGSSLLWDAQVQGLSEVANTVAVDLPGHGRTAGPGQNQVKPYADWVASLVRDLGLPRPVLAGLSMGGAITQQALLDHPDLFTAGVLISTGAKLKVMPLIFEAIEKDFAGYVKMTGQFSISPKTDPALLEQIQADTATREPAVVSGDFRACDAFDVRERLSEIKVPVLVITAQDDQLTPPKYGEYLAANIRGARRTHLPDAGHLVVVEQAPAVNLALQDFLLSLGAPFYPG